VSIGPATLNSGQAVLSTQYFTTAGAYKITAAYSGDSTYAASTSAVVDITVNAAIPATACGLQDSNGANATALDAYSSGTNTLSGVDATIQVSAADESAICAENSGTTLTVTSPAITSSSVGSNSSDSSYSGTNAAVLAWGSSATSASGASITINGGGTIGTTGQYGNGVFASGDGASIALNGTSITTTGANAHGADAAEGGTLDLTNVSITTSGQNSPAVATDQGGGSVTVNYGVFNAQNAEAVAVDGSGSINLTGTSLSSTMGNYRGILLYQDASVAGATSFTMSGGSISYTCPVTASSTTCSSGDATTGQNTTAAVFSVANTTATISLTDVVPVTNNTSTTTDSSGTLLTAAALSAWGTTGSNGGNVTFTAYGEALTGDVIVDQYSTAALTLKEDSATTPVPSTLTGAINNAKSVGTASLTLDPASSWTVTNTSYLTSLTGLVISGSNVVGNINGGGHCVYYSGNINGSSSTTTYTLSGTNGGYLALVGTTGLTCN
jgi:hypothetical protein